MKKKRLGLSEIDTQGIDVGNKEKKVTIHPAKKSKIGSEGIQNVSNLKGFVSDSDLKKQREQSENK